MDHLVELLTVADHFQIERVGLVVSPEFAPSCGMEGSLGIRDGCNAELPKSRDDCARIGLAFLLIRPKEG